MQEQLASLRLAVGKSEETIRSLRAELQSVKEELRAAKQELAAERAARQAAEAALADERCASAALKEAVRKLSLELHHARARLATDSANSSKPPSSDFPKKDRKGGSDARPDPKSLRKRSGRRPGAQKGHKGVRSHGYSLDLLKGCGRSRTAPAVPGRGTARMRLLPAQETMTDAGTGAAPGLRPAFLKCATRCAR